MYTLGTTLGAVALALDVARYVDQQQFHHGYTRVAMVMVLVAGCSVLALCGIVGALLFSKR
ncbi:MAG: hypothetical protein Q9O62_11275 [Ardenticatenia bacterium]|nr:hypothetical protein [Ardenticatenia bacterium]